MKIHRLLALLALAALTSPSLGADWNPALYNPVAADDDIMLPLPCGGSMAFRRVVTHQVANPDDPASLLADKEIELGRSSTSGERIYMEHRRADYISGSLTTEGGALSYLIGKYEVSQAQYAAVMADPASCPVSAKPADALPVSDVSWYDAVDFTRRINNWMYSSDATITSMLISLGITDSYVRLPTETEWEFAARGGLAVTDSERANTMFPMTESFDSYVWYNGPQSANGKLRPIGTRKPNPLGLFDIYGNVAEMILEPFRMTRVARMHGRIGGYISKGGSFLDEPGIISSALRNEHPYFSQVTNGEMHMRSVGFRVVVGTAAIGQATDVDALEGAALLAQQGTPEPGAAPDEGADAALKLALLAAETEDLTQRAEIERLSGQLVQEFERRNELERKAINASLINAALAARELSVTSHSLEKYTQVLDITPSDDPAYGAITDLYNQNYANFVMFAKRYTDAVHGLATDYAGKVNEQIPVVKRELFEQGSSSLQDFVELVGRQVALYASGEITETNEIIIGALGSTPQWM